MNKISETLLSLANTLTLLAEEVEKQSDRVDFIEDATAKNKATLKSMAQDILDNLN